MFILVLAILKAFWNLVFRLLLRSLVGATNLNILLEDQLAM